MPYTRPSNTGDAAAAAAPCQARTEACCRRELILSRLTFQGAGLAWATGAEPTGENIRPDRERYRSGDRIWLLGGCRLRSKLEGPGIHVGVNRIPIENGPYERGEELEDFVKDPADQSKLNVRVSRKSVVDLDWSEEVAFVHNYGHHKNRRATSVGAQRKDHPLGYDLEEGRVRSQWVDIYTNARK